MFNYKHIDGIDALNEKLPADLQFWHRISKVIGFDYSANTADEYYCDYTNVISMVISDSKEQYRIGLSLYNISGNINFDIVNGLGSGFVIDELSDSGNEKIFHLHSVEQDIEFDLYCEKIRVKIL